jgi:hypothetical protein
MIRTNSHTRHIEIRERNGVLMAHTLTILNVVCLPYCLAVTLTAESLINTSRSAKYHILNSLSGDY